MGIAFCERCGFGAEGALACVVCGSSLTGEPVRNPSQIVWVDDPTHLPQVRPAPQQVVLTAPGRVFAGKYQVLGSIGRGAMGLVLEAKELASGRRVALKLLLGDASDPKLVSRFRREVRIASELKHPNALEVYDAGVVDDACYYAMELVEGGSVAALLDAEKQLPFAQVEAIARQLLEVLSAAHALGVVHRDIKPSNVLLTRDGVVKLVDFGIAKMREGADATDLSKTGMMSGTAAYMAPEQIRDAKHADARADLYALGAMLFELVAGVPPFQGDSVMAVAVKHINEEPPQLATARVGVPPGLDRIVARCLKKDPAQRFQSAEEMLEALKAADAKATRERMPNGDMLVVHPRGARYAVEVHARDSRSDWGQGQLVLLDGQSYRLVNSELGRAPYAVVFQFEVQTDLASIGRLVDYRAFAAGAAAPVEEKGLFGRVFDKLRGK